jgi:hypothetical protein
VKISQYRTVGSVIILAAMLLVALAMCLHSPSSIAGEAFGTAAWCLVACAGLLAGKSLGEYAATGGGISGIVKAIFTNAKPADPSAPPIPSGPQP